MHYCYNSRCHRIVNVNTATTDNNTPLIEQRYCCAPWGREGGLFWVVSVFMELDAAAGEGLIAKFWA